MGFAIGAVPGESHGSSAARGCDFIAESIQIVRGMKEQQQVDFALEQVAQPHQFGEAPGHRRRGQFVHVLQRIIKDEQVKRLRYPADAQQKQVPP